MNARDNVARKRRATKRLKQYWVRRAVQHLRWNELAERGSVPDAWFNWREACKEASEATFKFGEMWSGVYNKTTNKWVYGPRKVLNGLDDKR